MNRIVTLSPEDVSIFKEPDPKFHYPGQPCKAGAWTY